MPKVNRTKSEQEVERSRELKEKVQEGRCRGRAVFFNLSIDDEEDGDDDPKEDEDDDEDREGKICKTPKGDDTEQ